MKYIRLLLIELLVMLACVSYAQLDTAFWFVAPEISCWNGGMDRPIIFNVASFNDFPVKVKVSMPANPEFPVMEETVAAFGNVTFDLSDYVDIVENRPLETNGSTPNERVKYSHTAFNYDVALNKGLLIEASADVSVYYSVGMTYSGANNPEVYALKGTNALGTEFYIPGQTDCFNGNTYQPTPLNRIDIVATEDGTEVTVYPANTMLSHNGLEPFTTTLNRGQTYSCVAVDRQASNHLQGTRVTSTKPIAITLTDDMLDNGGQDLIGDQLIPVERLGSEFIAIKGSLNRDRDKVYVTAVENGTEIYLNGASNIEATLNAGETYGLSFGSQQSMYFITSAPVYAWQLTGMGGEFGAAVLPHITCTGSTGVTYTRNKLSCSSGKSMKLNITIEKGNEGNFIFNNSNDFIMASDFQDVPGTNGHWVYASKEVPVSRLGEAQSFTLLNEANFHIGIFEGGTSNGCSYGFFSDFGVGFQLVAVSNHSDKANVFCEGDSLVLSLQSTEGMGEVHWEDPNGFYSTDPTTTVSTTLKQRHKGKYIVYADSDYGCEVLPDTVEVFVFPPDHVTIYDTICNGQIYMFNGKELDTEGTYEETFVNQHGCDSVVTLKLKVYFIDMDLGPELRFCDSEFESVTLDAGQDYYSYEWRNEQGQVISSQRSVVVTEPGTYHLVAHDEFGCVVEGDKVVTVIPNPDVIIELSPDEASFCENKQGTLTANVDGGADDYLWTTGETTGSIVITSPGTYGVRVTKDNCFSDTSITLQCPCNITIPNVFTPNGDGVNDLFQPDFESFFETYHMYIYDRWGKRVFSTTSQEEFWDGKIGSQDAADGVYYYVVTYSCNMTPDKMESRHGSLTVIR